MTKLQLKAFLLQLLCFATFFILARFLIEKYTHLTGFFIPITAFVISTLLSPKFQAVKTKEGEKLFLKWLFIKGIKEIN
jgi:hypothetical protein